MGTFVEISRLAKKQIRSLPRHIVEKLSAWVFDVENRGIAEVRKSPGFHDEPLKGKRQGQRSIRLNIAYRAIYRIGRRGNLELVVIEEVNKHEY